MTSPKRKKEEEEEEGEEEEEEEDKKKKLRKMAPSIKDCPCKHGEPNHPTAVAHACNPSWSSRGGGGSLGLTDLAVSLLSGLQAREKLS